MSSSTSATMTNSPLRIRDLGYIPGGLRPGSMNSILDVPGVQIGQATKIDGNRVKAGVTVIFPRPPEHIRIPCHAGMHTLNGNGQVTGSFQIKDWGYVNTPLALTNSTSLGTVYDGIWKYTLAQAKKRGDTPRMMGRDYGTPVVGETADWWLNSIPHSLMPPSIVQEAIERAATGTGQSSVLEGQHGGGAGMTCHMFPGGTGTSSRVVDGERDGKAVRGLYTLGVICQSNYGYKEYLNIGGVPIGKILLREATEASKALAAEKEGGRVGDGSIVIYIITDAPMLPHQLIRLAQRAGVGLAVVGGHGVGRNTSGDIFLAVSTANGNSEQLSGASPNFALPLVETNTLHAIKNESMDALFRAASEATEEAILNSIVAGRDGRMTYDGNFIEGLPCQRVKELLDRYLVRF